jgi:hypothetical protein
MAPNPRLQDERLAALYARVPDVECRGLCQQACTAIGMSVRERAVAEAALGGPVTCAPDGVCSALDGGGRCGIYEARPMVCRLWGAVDDMPCPHGCRPRDGGPLLAEHEGRALEAASIQAGGRPGVRQLTREIDVLERAIAREAPALFRTGALVPARLGFRSEPG